jgi:hypothetical protein
VYYVENAIDVQRLANLKIRGIYKDERSEEDLTV